MSYETEHIAQKLKAARKEKGLSQRELSKRAGVPQSHISKIENGAVDLRLSSLVELARALDLELTLVPRKAVSAVQSIVRSSARATPPDTRAKHQAAKELQNFQKNVAAISNATGAPKELAQLQRQLRELQHFPLAKSDLESIQNAKKTFKKYLESHNDLKAIRASLSQLQSLRNALAHAPVHTPRIEYVKSAYSLDEDDNG